MIRDMIYLLTKTNLLTLIGVGICFISLTNLETNKESRISFIIGVICIGTSQLLLKTLT